MSQSASFKEALIGEYELVAKYYRTMISLARHRMNIYNDKSEETLKGLEFLEYNALDFQNRANQLKGSDTTNGFEESIFETTVSSQVSWEMGCTTVL